MTDTNEDPHKEFRDLEERILRLQEEISDITLAIEDEYINFMKEHFYNKETCRFKYETLTDAQAGILASRIINRLRNDLAYVAKRGGEGNLDQQQLHFLDDLILDYTGHTEHTLRQNLAGEILTLENFKNLVIKPASQKFREQRFQRYETELVAAYHDSSKREHFKGYLNEKLAKYNYKLHPGRELMPRDAISLFFDAIRGLPEDYHKGKEYLLKLKT